MKSFLLQTAEYIQKEFNGKYQEICIVLPGKRGRIFLKNHLAEISGGTVFFPDIISVEELMQEISGLNQIDNISLNLELYIAWKKIKNKDAFEEKERLKEFLKWSNTILHDFNEIDRSLANADSLFTNLSDIKHIENWSLGREELSEFQKRYLKFMDSLGELYHLAKDQLLEKKQGWQGLISRIAAENVGKSDFTKRYERFIFCGFNALNACEIKLFKHLKNIDKASFIWDADQYYLDDVKQEAGNFIRKNFKELDSVGFISDELKIGNKNFELIAAPGMMSQVLVASEKIRLISQTNPELKSTAVVLADESLLQPLTSCLPESVEKVNITLEYPLKLTALFDLYDLIMQWQTLAEEQNKKTIQIYHKDFFRFFHNPCIKNLIQSEKRKVWKEVLDKIAKYNINFINPGWLSKNWPETFQSISFIFERWVTVEHCIENLFKLNNELFENIRLKKNLSDSDKLELEYIHNFKQALTGIKNKHEKYDCIEDVSSFLQLLRDVVGDLAVSFVGEPLVGLQIMGVLESRTLDFENLIIVGLNEGKLPAGNKQNSFVPNDLKKYFGLLLTKDKDAVFAYHFYRILQRAKNIYLVYDTESDQFGSGEKSRFITQLESEYLATNHEASVKGYVATTALPEYSENELSVLKDNSVIEGLIKKFSNEKGGLSASSINSYQQCELRFWYNYVAGIKENEEVEEGMEHATFGIILHHCLEKLYKSLENKKIEKKDLDWEKDAIRKIILQSFNEFFPEEKDPKGKNLLAINILHEHIERQLKEDKKNIDYLEKQSKHLTFIGSEVDLSDKIKVQLGSETYELNLKGRIDRVDAFGDELRIIDYKSSINTNNDNFHFTGVENIFLGNKNSKMIQLFIYAWLAWKKNLAEPNKILPCIVPFKNKKEEPYYLHDSDKKKIKFSAELLMEFELKVIEIISNILNPNIPFRQTSDTKICLYCSYKSVCNR
jgi:ATP-dependent helicase/nuclease subunit B